MNDSRVHEVGLRELPGAPDPADAIGLLSGLPGRVLLHSAGPHGRFSFLAAAPRAVLVANGGETRVITESGDALGFADPFTAIEALLRRLGRDTSARGLPFVGGLVGYVSYECGRHLERLPAPPSDDLGLPEAWFGAYDASVVWDRMSGRCFAAALNPGDAGSLGRLESLVQRLRGPGPAAGVSRSGPPDVFPMGSDGSSEATTTATTPTSSLSRPEFVRGVERIRRYVRAGDVFQANLTRRITTPTRLTGPELYRRLLAQSPAEFSAYLDTGEGEVASISPELFLELHDGQVRTGPIKGTAPRGTNKEEDRALALALAASAKDRAENVMIVDLLRNDLSRVCKPGSVRVPRLADLETLPTVHHLVSSVTGVLEGGVGPVGLLRAAFPGGSVTGAPKIRATEILRELEPVRRGVYTGALGRISFDGAADLSIAIRTAVLRDGVASYGTGAGITLGSDPEAEWQETEDKARAFLDAIGSGTPPCTGPAAAANVSA